MSHRLQSIGRIRLSEVTLVENPADYLQLQQLQQTFSSLASVYPIGTPQQNNSSASLADNLPSFAGKLFSRLPPLAREPGSPGAPGCCASLTDGGQKTNSPLGRPRDAKLMIVITISERAIWPAGRARLSVGISRGRLKSANERARRAGESLASRAANSVIKSETGTRTREPPWSRHRAPGEAQTNGWLARGRRTAADLYPWSEASRPAGLAS